MANKEYFPFTYWPSELAGLANSLHMLPRYGPVENLGPPQPKLNSSAQNWPNTGSMQQEAKVRQELHV